MVANQLVEQERNQMRYIFFLYLILHISGCVSFREFNIAEVESLAPTKSKQSLTVVVNGAVFLNGNKTALAPGAIHFFRQKTERAYRDSNLFSQVESAQPFTPLQEMKSDLVAEVFIKSEEEGSVILAVLSGFTMYLVPSWSTSKYTSETKLMDRKGKILKEVTHSDSLSIYNHLLLVFGAPFTDSSAKISEDIMRDLARSSLEEMTAAGVL